MQEEIIYIYPPIVGIMLDITEVPDPVFAQKMVGDGIAIDPLFGKIYSPIDGIIRSVHLAKHAIIIGSRDGFDVLVHIGLETAGLNGNGFNIHVSDNQEVKRGDVIGEFDLDYISQCAKTLITPVVLVDLDKNKFSFTINKQYETNLANPILQITKKIPLTKEHQKNSKTKYLLKSPPILINNPHGIHARPAAAISSLAAEYNGEIYIEKDTSLVNAKSIISLLGLAISQNESVIIYAPSQAIIERLSNKLSQIYDKPEELRIYHKSATVPSKFIEGSKYYGTAASIGTVCGVLVKRNSLKFIIEEHANNPAYEKKQLLDALATVKKDIEHSLENLTHNDMIYKGILNAHLQILCDPDLTFQCLEIINNNKTAAYALNHVIEASCILIAQSNNSLLVERQGDFRDLCHRILSAMDKIEVRPISFKEPTILLADELTPTDLVKIDKNLIGLISVNGGMTSHAAIIARAKSIPFLVGVDKSILEIKDNIQVVLNSTDGYVDINPCSDELDLAKVYVSELKHKRAIDILNANLDSQTKDGYFVECMANITGVTESENISVSGASGVGLFRTEFIFFGRKKPPTIEEQYKIYSDIANNLGDSTFIIRTLDAGGDKKIGYLKLPREENPVLGLRGIRLCLERKDLLINQLTAIAMLDRPNIKIMLPMVSSIEEYRVVQEIFDDIKTKHNITADIELGIMVEVPSVALLGDIFAREVAFFSIGTNDLSQYTLAIAREHSKLAGQIDHLHPAVIRNIDLLVKGAKTQDRPVSVCGLMASERIAIPLLIGLGVNQLSMNPSVIAENKAFIRSLNYTDCVEAAEYCLQLATTVEVRQYLSDRFINIITT